MPFQRERCISLISTLEILVLIVGSATLAAFVYSSFHSFSIRKVLYGSTYRKRALWTGSFATYSALEIAVIVYFPYIVGSFAVDFTWLIIGSALLFILTAWISSTIKVVISLDPFHGNHWKWRQAEKFVWLTSAIIAAMNIAPALVLLGYIKNSSNLELLYNTQLTLFIALFIYLITVATAYETVIYDKLLKSYLESFIYLLIILMLDIALSPVSSALGLFIGPFALTDSLLILSAFFMYKMSKSLISVITKTNL